MDATLDRLGHNAYQIILKSKSMRKRQEKEIRNTAEAMAEYYWNRVLNRVECADNKTTARKGPSIGDV